MRRLPSDGNKVSSSSSSSFSSSSSVDTSSASNKASKKQRNSTILNNHSSGTSGKLVFKIAIGLFVCLVIVSISLAFSSSAASSAFTPPTTQSTSDKNIDPTPPKKVYDMSFIKRFINTPIQKIRDDVLTILNFGPRPVGSHAHIKTQQYLAQSMASTKVWKIDFDTFRASTPVGSRNFTNIIATLPGSSPRRIVLAAHYDSKYMPQSNPPFVGATDSALPCALLLDLARTIADVYQSVAASSPTFHIVFFDGEEAFGEWTDTDSIYGARHLAELWEQAKILPLIDSFVLLDLLGAASPRFHDFHPSTSHLFRRLKTIETNLRKDEILPASSSSYFADTPQHHTGGVQDDHIPFQQRGVPVLHLIPLPFPNVWHTHRDDIHALDWATIQDLTIILRQFVSGLILKP